MNKKILLGLCLLLILVGLYIALNANKSEVLLPNSASTTSTMEQVPTTSTPTTTPSSTPAVVTPAVVTPATPPAQQSVLSYGDVTLKLGARAVFKDISVRAVEVTEDSRCPKDVQCIQAGTVRLKIEVAAGMRTSASIITLGKVFTMEGEAITLTGVTPVKNSKVTIESGDYRFTLSVVKQSVAGTPSPKPDPKAKCYVGGCSAQLCTDQPGMASTCEYTASYACYKSATCERQPSGQCGWTPSPTLSACLSDSSSKATPNSPQ